MYPAADRGRRVRLPFLALMSEQNYPEPIVGALILDEKGRIFLVKAPKWRGKYALVGGHVEFGESLESALKREVKEETNLDVSGLDFLGLQEAIYSDAFSEKKHFIFFDYACRAKEGEVILNEEATDYLWVRPEEALLLPLNPFTLVTVKQFIEKFSNGP